MTKQFTPTKEQLEKLAKVANQTVWTEIYTGKLCYYTEVTTVFSLTDEDEETPYVEWKPHKDRDQIAMVIEGLDKYQQELYLHKMTIDIWQQTVKGNFFGVRMQTVPAHISCEKLLAAI